MRRLFGLITLLLLSSCVSDFLSGGGEGECKGLPEPNLLMSELVSLYEGATFQITEDWVIEGYVISSDEAGNFFGSLHFQDHPSKPGHGLQLEIDLPKSYLWYPPGTRILVKLNGLYLGKRKGVLMLGGAFPSFGNLSVGRLPARMVPQHIIAACGGPVELQPVETDIAGLDETPVNTLVHLQGVQLIEEENGEPFALPETDTARNLEDCNGNQLILQNSRYADFAATALPSGKGSITAVHTQDNNRSLLRIRNLEDIAMEGERCLDGSVPGETESGDEQQDENEETGDPNAVLITELADPDNNPDARFLELYNAGDQAVSLEGWILRRYTNANTEAGAATDLSGFTIQAGGFLLLSPDADTFAAVYGINADLEVAANSAADSNGDDNMELVNAGGEIVDIFGRVGEDGSGTDHEFEDGRAVRLASVTRGSAVFDPGEWEIYNDTGAEGTINQPQQAPGDFSPGIR